MVARKCRKCRKSLDPKRAVTMTERAAVPETPQTKPPSAGGGSISRCASRFVRWTLRSPGGSLCEHLASDTGRADRPLAPQHRAATRRRSPVTSRWRRSSELGGAGDRYIAPTESEAKAPQPWMVIEHPPVAGRRVGIAPGVVCRTPVSMRVGTIVVRSDDPGYGPVRRFGAAAAAKLGVWARRRHRRRPRHTGRYRSARDRLGPPAGWARAGYRGLRSGVS